MNQDSKEIAGMLFVLVIVVSGLQWFLVRFAHWSVAIGIMVFIAIVISFLYVSLSHATPNGGSNGSNTSEFITPALVVFTSLLCGLALVCYLAQIRLPKTVFILPLMIMALFVVSRTIYQYVYNLSVHQSLFSHCNLHIVNKSKGSVVTKISFQNSNNDLSTSIDYPAKVKLYPYIPRATDKLIFHCYSDKTGLFLKNFLLDYSLCKEKVGPRMGLCFWLREKVVLPITIALLPDNKVDLYIGNHLVKHFQLNTEEVLIKEKKELKMQLIS